MNQIWETIAVACRERALGRDDVIATVCVRVVATDLRLQHHRGGGLFDALFPGTGFGHIGQDGFHVRVQALEYGQIRRMLVDHDDPAEPFRLEQDDEVLTDEAGAAEQDDLC